ncbi:MAG: hypothetical protein JWP74_1756 [Marmoricola sp.]|nr:hypothetical protein [Marmoricola sp.]
MSEAAPEGGTNSGETPAAEEFKAITSQDDLNKVINERLTRERAKFADYKDLKTKAGEFDKLQQANQTEAEKAQARIAELESEMNAVKGESTRLRIAGEHGITDADDIRLFLTGTDEETLTEQAKRLAERTADRKKNGNHVPREGSSPASKESEGLETVRALFGSG